jgi:hypothetical protein
VSLAECDADSGTYDGSTIECDAAMCPVMQPTQAAPALSSWGLLLTAALLTGAGLTRLRRQQR